MPIARLLARAAALAALAVPFATLPARAAEDLRVPATLPYDANVTRNLWVDASVTFRSWPGSDAFPKANDFALVVDGAFELFPKIEVGANTSLVQRDYRERDLSSGSGLTDTQVWGKYRLFEDQNVRVGAGAIVSLPTGSKGDGLGTGNPGLGVFVGAGTRTAGNAFVQGFVGLRQNDDLDNSVTTTLNGRNSLFVGFGGVVPAQEGLEAFASLMLETERWRGAGTFAQLTGGGRWRIGNAWKLQAQAGVGFGDSAPRFALGFGFVYAP